MSVADATRRAVLLAVHPHPDDEAIACGGVLARYAEAGVPTAVVTCTGGEEGGNWGGVDLAGRTLEEVRRDELARSLELLGVTVHHWLGYRDSGMAGTRTNHHPDSFAQAPLDAAARRLATVIRELRPAVVVSDDRHGTYGHPDHVKANAVTARAAELAADPDAPVGGEPWTVARRYEHTISRGRMVTGHRALVALGLPSPFGGPDVDASGIPFGTPDEDVTLRLDVTPWLQRKQAAIRAHASQLGPDSFFLNVPDELAAVVFGVEEFRLAAGTPVTDGADLLAGLPAGGEAAPG